MVVYVEMPGDQAGEGNVREGVGRVDRFRGRREGAGVNIGESEFDGTSAKAAGRGVNVEVEDIC